MKNKLKSVIKKAKKDPRNIIVPIVSILILIVSSFSIGLKLGILLFVVINSIYFIPIILKSKNKGKKKKKKSKKSKKKKLKIVLLIILIGFILGIISIIAFFSYIVVKAPDFSEDLLYVTEPSVLYDKDGNEIAKLGTEKRIIVTYDELPEVLIDAIVATEDSRFFEHKGVDWARFLKASAYQALGKSEAGGASTLTMQVSKNNISRDTTASGIKGVLRKFTDVYISLFKIEKKYTKQQIMEFYVNSYYLGNSSYGVEQAALSYFGKSAKDLNLAEASMIAGLFQSPGRYNPYTNPEITEKRRQTVLKLMLRHEYITKEEYDIAKKMTVDKIIVPKESNPNTASEISPYQSFIDTVVDEINEKTGENPYTTSMIIYTTLNTDFQKYVNSIMNGEIYSWENDEAQAGIAVLDARNGSIVAIGGNRNVNAIDMYNHATDIKNQIGSTAKPLYDYGPAIEYNNWSSYQILVDEPISYSDGTKINNWNGAYEGFETMRIALKGSRNIPALKTFKANDKAKVISFVESLGLSPEIYSCKDGYKLYDKQCINKEDPDDIIDAIKSTTLHEAHAIGGYNGESPLTLAAAYSAFANQGYYTKPYSFTKLIYQDTNEEFINDIQKDKVMSEETAYIISDMLATTATQALGGFYNINGVRYAAKTGTTNFDDKTLITKGLVNTGAVNDLWAVGYNTEYTIGVWYGYDVPTSEYYNRLGTVQHEKLFQVVGKKVFTNQNYFNQPEGVVAIEVESECPEATLPSEFTPSNLRQTELFIKGTQPTNVSPRFEKLSDVSNLKATVDENTVKLTWNEVPTPEINTQNYLTSYFSSVFETGFLNSFVSSRMEYNNAYIGKLGYNIYKKNSDGSLTLLDFTTTNKYETTLEKAGNYTIVVKTSYSIFKANMSDGKSVNVNIKSNLLPSIIDDDEDDDSTNTNNNDNNNNSNNNTIIKPPRNNNTNGSQIR